MSPNLELVALPGLPEISAGAKLGGLLASAVERVGVPLSDDDAIVVSQKVVSKAEGRVRRLDEVEPGERAVELAGRLGKDPRLVELVLAESRRIVRAERGVLIVETHRGWICANAGIDASNVPGDGTVVLLPEDPDASARALRDRLREATGAAVAVLITDTFGRAWREGLLDVALGAAGIEPMLDLRGQQDLNGRDLHHTVLAQADALAAAAGLLMRKGDRIPAVLVRGYRFAPSDAGGAALVRARENDLFR